MYELSKYCSLMVFYTEDKKHSLAVPVAENNIEYAKTVYPALLSEKWKAENVKFDTYMDHVATTDYDWDEWLKLCREAEETAIKNCINII